MKNRHLKIRVFLLMLALGLSSVSFFTNLYREFVLDSMDLPQTVSDSYLFVSPENGNFTGCCDGGSGPDGRDKPQEIINTLETGTRPHIIKNAEIQGIELRNADLTASEIENSDLGRASLRKADFSKASVFYSGFASANLKDADFTGARFFSSDLAGADFSGAKLVRANFAHSDFSDANLKNADLTDANLSNADLKSVKNLTYEQISRAIINEFTLLPAKFRSKNSVLLMHSRQRMKELRRQMSAGELELFSNEFDFLD